MAATASPPRGADTNPRARRLPTDLTSFIGREAQIASLLPLVRSSRLLTLTGPGGSGKTRLALELVRRLDDQADATFVEVAPLNDPGLLSQHVAFAFDVHEQMRDGDPAALVDVLRRREALLILDNCEHLVDACARLVAALLRDCPGLRILATSREALGVGGERAWPVPAMALPVADASFADLEASEAVQLFAERARDVAAGFSINAQNVRAVAEICRRLDGIPLALELAAARLKVLSPEQIRDRLDDAFQLLTSGRRTTVPRHRTLRAAIDWSHDLLPDSSRTLFRRLAVFRGGFSLEAVEAIGADASGRPEVLDRLEGLIDRSLVVVHEIDGEARYTLLETVRQYALARLLESGEAETVRHRHASWILDHIEEAEPHLIRPERRKWFERLFLDIENIRDALQWSQTGDATLHVRLVGSLWWFWIATRYWMEARSWIEHALDLAPADLPDRDRARLLFAAGALASMQTRVEPARAWLHECLALVGDCDAAGLAGLIAYARAFLALSFIQVGDLSGVTWAQQALAWFREDQDLNGMRLSLTILGSSALAAGDIELSRQYNTEGLDAARRFGQDREMSIALQNLATSRYAAGDLAGAEALLREGLACLRRDPAFLYIARNLELLGALVGSRGDALNAARYLGAAASVRAVVGAQAFEIDKDRVESLLPKLRALAGEAAFDRAWHDGEALSAGEILDELAAAPPPASADTSAGTPTAFATEPVATTSEPSAHPRASRSAPASTPRADLEIRALGTLDVTVDGNRLDRDAWTYAKPRELLLQLVEYTEGRTREQIGQALWPGSTPAQAKNSFHVTLHHLRRILARPTWIVADGDHYRIAPEVRIDFDAARFERQAAEVLRRGGEFDESRLRGVLALYTGDLLEGETAAWIAETRDRLRQRHVELSLCLARALESRGDVDAAAGIYHDITIREDLNEEAHRGLMTCWARSGHRSRALRHYARVVETLRDVLDAEPEPETIALYERLRTAGTA